MMTFTSNYQSPLGEITLASDGDTLTGLWFSGQKYVGDTIKQTPQTKNLPIFVQTRQWLDIYFSGQPPTFTPPLTMLTTPFRRRVWEIMLTIPFGQTLTYGEIAKLIAGENKLTKMSAQAVGGAVGHNSIALIIPCHRIIGTQGKLTGYAGGLDKKLALLKLEKVNGDNLYLPKQKAP